MTDHLTTVYISQIKKNQPILTLLPLLLYIQLSMPFEMCGDSELKLGKLI